MKLLLIFSLCGLISIVLSKPVYGPIGVAEKHQIKEMLDNERKSLELLREEEELLEKVVETLSREIEEKETRVEELKSLTNGRQIVENILEDYRRNFGANNSQFRPG